MSYRWQMLSLSVVVVAALAARSAAADPELKQSDSQKIDAILQQLKDLKTTVDTLEQVRKDLKGLETKEEHSKAVDTINARIDELNGRIGGLDGRITQVQKELEAVRAQTTTSNRISGYAGPGNGATPPPLTGPIRLHNTFPDQVSIVVNGQSYQLLPGDTQILPSQPAGPFTYEVLGIQAPRTVTLVPNERFTVTVYPR